MSKNEQYSGDLSLPDVLSIRGILSIHSNIFSVLQNNDRIILDIPENAEADLSSVQLIEAARRYAYANDKTISLASPASGQILKVLQRAGFVEAFDSEDTKFWLHEEVNP